MCKHILNAQVSVRAPCCHRWFDCPQCHAEQSDHTLRRTMEVTLICKKCKKAFRKDMTDFEAGSDDRCPACDNLYVLAARTPGLPRQRPPQEEEQADIEDDDRLDNRLAAHLDDRQFSRRTLVSAARREHDQAISERIDEGGWSEALRQAKDGGAASTLFLGSNRDAEEAGEREDGHGGGAASRRPDLMNFNDDDLDWN
ncbi:hypothetical protein CF319_g3815 [Tilletia indica]|uniref:CHY-type domain-containing protein n=2 Tax=Tilletia TaxID=13289 RepID=A0A8X7N6H2_9BASI|nr:hypothetical protein CF327_g1927 [Tilletia walkeri]KAE8223098.1 hypothetical protein CF319_g3815 [Tilletia indica]KAE8254540.1 hypothetical protein A4X13_0g3378 [Tilletia indica]KAE8268072.1 hypothetical protein A4X09_0g4272 [Tilletia walkeri]